MHIYFLPCFLDSMADEGVFAIFDWNSDGLGMYVRCALRLELLTVLLRCHGLVLEKGLGHVILFPLRRTRQPGHFDMVLTPVSILRSYCRPNPCTVSLRGIFQRVPARQVFLPETRQGRAEIPPQENWMGRQ